MDGRAFVEHIFKGSSLLKFKSETTEKPPSYVDCLVSYFNFDVSKSRPSWVLVEIHFYNLNHVLYFIDKVSCSCKKSKLSIVSPTGEQVGRVYI